MINALFDYEIIEGENKDLDSGQNLIEVFISAKRIEGCSEKSLKYYRATIEAMLAGIQKEVKQIVTDDIRSYLTEYQAEHHSSRVTIDNIRRILSSFFSWLEDEDYILKSPVRRIHKVKTASNIKESYIPELSLVYETDGKIVGHIMFASSARTRKKSDSMISAIRVQLSCCQTVRI